MLPPLPSQPSVDGQEEVDLTHFDERVKGFLELNPYACSGCGSPFQSKRADSPGFLEKDKLKAHFEQAKILKEKQNAIGILRKGILEMSTCLFGVYKRNFNFFNY